jgi:hypothetical protein
MIRLLAKIVLISFVVHIEENPDLCSRRSTGKTVWKIFFSSERSCSDSGLRKQISKVDVDVVMAVTFAYTCPEIRMTVIIRKTT